MEIDFYSRIQFDDQKALALAKLMLKADSDAPMFDDEVEEPLRAVYNVLESVEVADVVCVDKTDRSATAHWLINSVGDVQCTFDELMELSCVIQIVILYFDDENSAFSRIMCSGETKDSKLWNGKPLNELDQNTDMISLLKKIHDDRSGDD